jgi:hypothetical protein
MFEIKRFQIKEVTCFFRTSRAHFLIFQFKNTLIYFCNFSLLCVLFEIPAAAVLRLLCCGQNFQSQTGVRPRQCSPKFIDSLKEPFINHVVGVERGFTS